MLVFPRMPKAGLFISMLVLILSSILTIPAFSQTTSGSTMIYRSSGSSQADGSHLLNRNGYLGTFVSVASPGPVTFTINAKGTSAVGLQAFMDLHVADSKASWFVSDSAYTNYTATFHLPSGIFALRIEFTNDYSGMGQDRNLYVKSLTVSSPTASLLNVNSDANALASADSYIANYRRETATVSIIDAEGRPLPAGVSVRAKLRNHTFNWGTCVPGSFGDLWWTNPNPTPGSDTDRYQKFIKSHFNMITPEACGKWAYQEATRDVVIMDYVDAYLDFAERNGYRARMHGVLWDDDGSEPAWVNELENKAKAGDIAAANELRAEISERIQYFVAPRAGRYPELDCINETNSHPLFTTIYGLSGVASIYNETAAAAAGRTRIFVNEWNEFRELSTMPNSQYAEWYRMHIQSLLDAGATIQGIGCQTNLDGRYPTYARNFHRCLQNLDGFEIPISTTEYRCTIGYDSVNQMNMAMRMIFGNDKTTTFLMWGFWKNAIYSPNNEVLVNPDWTLSAAGVEFERLMALWSTDETVTTDANSSIRFTGFYGDYDITINGEVYSLKLVKGTNNYQLVINSPVIIDTFERATSINLGVTEDANHKTWVKAAGDAFIGISNNQLTLMNSTANGLGVGIGDGYSPADFDLKINLTITGTGSSWAGIAYRQTQAGNSNDGYSVRFLASGNNVQLWRSNSIVSVFMISPSIDWKIPQCVRVTVTGNKHEVWVGSRKLLNYSDGNKLTGGYLNFVRANCGATFDNLVVSHYQLPSPVTFNAAVKVKDSNDRSLVELSNQLVTRAFTGFFYVQDANRTSGIKVVSSKPVTAGDAVSLNGITGTTDGERLINAWDVTASSSGNSIIPLGMSNHIVGGGVCGLQDSVLNWKQGQPDSVDGLNNIGLCVRVYGQVTQVDPNGKYFYIDDGSKLDDNTFTSGLKNYGVRVASDGRSYRDKYIAITGVSSCFKGTDGKLRRLIRVAGSGDIQVVE